MTNTNVVFPSIRQTTLASSTSKLSSQTVPQFPRNLTSTIPESPSPLLIVYLKTGGNINAKLSYDTPVYVGILNYTGFFVINIFILHEW